MRAQYAHTQAWHGQQLQVYKSVKCLMEQLFKALLLQVHLHRSITVTAHFNTKTKVRLPRFEVEMLLLQVILVTLLGLLEKGVLLDAYDFRSSGFPSVGSGWTAGAGGFRGGRFPGPDFYSNPTPTRFTTSPPPTAAPPTIPTPTPTYNNVTNPVVQTRDGLLRGLTMRTISSRQFSGFQGIPFAQPPVGALRFADPRKNLPWSGIRDAIAPGAQCIQLDLIKQNEIHGSEDCLYLNVYTPLTGDSIRSGRKLPVLVWIHGGGFFFGAGQIYGPAYLLNQDVVLVTLNYRLGPFGFLSTGDDISPGNQGLKDQVLALQWVQQNIHAFGGDPNSVTIQGQSAGATSVHYHFVSPLSRGLFHRGISESGSSMCYWELTENPLEKVMQLASLVNCGRTTVSQQVDCLRTVDASMIAGVQLNMTEWFVFPFPNFGAVVEHNHPGAFLVETITESYKQNRAAKVPWLIGYNRNEMSWLASGLILVPSLVSDINNDWDRVGRLLLSINNRTGNDVEIVRRVRQYYMGDRDFTFETRHEFAAMFGDRLFIECGLDAMRYHSRFTGQPVYAYRFSYTGRYSIVQLTGSNPSDWGVAHLDELLYLFNNTDYYVQQPQPGDEEYRMSQLMTSTWVNYATYGRPLINVGGQLQDIWKPIPPATSRFSPLRFLDLNLNPRMIDDPFVERYNFWRGLRLIN